MGGREDIVIENALDLAQRQGGAYNPGIQQYGPAKAEDATRTTSERAYTTADRMRDNSHMSTDKTAEMHRTEQAQRRADYINNMRYWTGRGLGGRSDVRGGGQGGVVAGGNEIWAPDKMESEGQREHVGNRERYMGKLGYEELEKEKAINDIAFKIDSGGQFNQSDIEKMILAGDQAMYQMLRTNREQLRAAYEKMPLDILEQLAEAATGMNVTAATVREGYRLMSINVAAGMSYLNDHGIVVPDFIQAGSTLATVALGGMQEGARAGLGKVLGTFGFENGAEFINNPRGPATNTRVGYRP